MMQTATQPKAAPQQALVKRVREFITPLNLHFAGLALLVLVNLYLLIHMAIAWRAASSQDADAIAQQTTLLHAAEHSAQPLRGLDSKLTAATGAADDFYQRRLPYAYSQLISELGSLSKKQGIKLAHVQYAQSAILEGAAGEVREVRMDASLTGDYRPLMLFLNSLERDRTFFLITGVTLTGQQSGTVNLRIKLNSYLRPALANESIEAQGLPADDSAETEGAPQ
jgi:type IV pilus assembly protein PilO